MTMTPETIADWQERLDAHRLIIKELVTKLDQSVPKEQYDRDLEAVTKICGLQSQLIAELRERAGAYKTHPLEIAILDWLAKTTDFREAMQPRV